MTFRAYLPGNDETTQVGASQFTFTVPSSVVAGDVLVYMAVTNSGTNTLTISGGNVVGGSWDVLDGPSTINSNQRVYLWTAVATSTTHDSTVTIDSVGGTGRLIGGGLVESAVTKPGSGDWALTSDSTSDTSLVWPNVSVSTNGSDLVGLGSMRVAAASAATMGTPTGSTSRGRSNTNTASPNYSIDVFTSNSTVNSGSRTLGTATASAAVTNQLYSVALAPSTVAYTVSAGLSGSGTLSAAGSAPTATQAAALGGSGTLAGLGTPGYARSAPLSGSGTLAGTGVSNYARAAALSGNGTLGALPSQGFVIPVALSGSGELQAEGVGFAAAQLNSMGTIVGFPYAPAVFMTAALSSIGSLAGQIAPGFDRASLMSGSGTLTAVGIIAPRLAALDGAGYLSTFQQSLARLGLVVPITYRLGGTLPVAIYLGSNLVWRP